jgi:hypothetical protein
MEKSSLTLPTISGYYYRGFLKQFATMAVAFYKKKVLGKILQI